MSRTLLLVRPKQHPGPCGDPNLSRILVFLLILKLVLGTVLRHFAGDLQPGLGTAAPGLNRVFGCPSSGGKRT